MKEDKVNHPSHYTWLKKLCGIEVIDITRHMCFNLGNVVKYVLRAGHKSEEGYSDQDKEIEDLKKAKWYLEDEIKLRTGEVNDPKEKTSELMELLDSVTKENYDLKHRPVIGEVHIAPSEVLQLAKEIEKLNISGRITIRSRGGNGIGPEIEYMFTGCSENPETIVGNVTDVTTW